MLIAYKQKTVISIHASFNPSNYEHTDFLY